MPTFLVEAAPVSAEQHERAVRLAATRFPELAVEARYGDHEGGAWDIWVCHAPSAHRVTRWAQAAGLALDEIRHVHPAGLPVRTTDAEEPP